MGELVKILMKEGEWDEKRKPEVIYLRHEFATAMQRQLLVIEEKRQCCWARVRTLG
jgi:hypothetical protein